MTAVLLALLLTGWLALPASAARIKDIVSVNGVRSNQLVGYGLVVGLNGTGDSLRNSPFTEQALQSMLDRMGVNTRTAKLRTKNVAAVIVTAELPAFVGQGSRIDVSASSLGDASSLAGGSLVMTPLYGPDNQIYAVAQGPVAASGFSAKGQAEKITQGVPTGARIPNGALVEREPPSRFGKDNYLVLELRNPDFNTAVRVADAINAYCEEHYGTKPARARDLRNITVVAPTKKRYSKRSRRSRRGGSGYGRRGLKDAPISGNSWAANEEDVNFAKKSDGKKLDTARFLAEIGELEVEADITARVVVDERTGTIVIGNDVRISTVAVAHGNLTVRVTETPKVSQPNPFAEGQTVVVPDTTITADQEGGKVAIMHGTSLHTLVRGLNRMGLKPPSIIAILQAIKSAGALQADLVVQ
ncbi:MAG: flagellar basal body P-ring protein FlgI [Alphaproteobacteria bacterium]